MFLMQLPLCCPSPPAAGFGEWETSSAAAGMQAVLGWGKEPGDGGQALVPSQELPFSAEPVLLNALGFFFVVSSLEPFGSNGLVNCYGLEPKSLRVMLATVEASAGS